MLKKITLAATAAILLTVAGLSANTAISTATGNSITVWDDFNSGFVIYAAAQNNGTFNPAPMISIPTHNGSMPRATMNSASYGAAVWIGTDPVTFQSHIYGSFYTPATILGGPGGWSAQAQLSVTATSSAGEYPNNDYEVHISDPVLLTHNGIVVVTWSSYLPPLFNSVRRGIRCTFGTWTAPVTITKVP